MTKTPSARENAKPVAGIAAESAKYNQHTGHNHPMPSSRSAGGAITTVVDTLVLANHIATLKAQKASLESVVEKPADVGECGGSTIAKMEELASLFQKIQDMTENLLDKTIQYLENRKMAVDEKENTSAETVGQVSK